MIRYALFTGALFLAPAVAFAAEDLRDVLEEVAVLIGLATPIVVALALLAFFWGLAMYIFSFGGDSKDDSKKKGRDIMIWGILALFIMVSVWGIVNVIAETFLEGTPNTIEVPTVDTD